MTIGSSRFFQIMDWISVSIVYSHLTYYELGMIHDRKLSRSVSCFAHADCSLKKARFTVFEKSEISFVLRIIKRNYKLRFSGITTSQGLGIRTPERGLGPLFTLVVVLLLRDNVLIGRVLSLLWLSSGGLAIRIPERGLGPLCSLGAWWLVVVVPRGPGN